MTTGPDEVAAAGRGHLRAAHADRERVIALLKAAFVQGRLTKDELEARAALAFASKTYAELSALTADIPPASAVSTLPPAPDAPAAPGPASTPAWTLGRAARRSGVCLIIAVALTEGAFLTNNGFFLVLAFFGFIAASGFIGYGVTDARQERRSRGQLPPSPGHGGRGRDGGRPGHAGPDPAPPGPHADHIRTDLRAHGTRAGLPAGRAPAGLPALRPRSRRRRLSWRVAPVPAGI